MKSRYIVGVLIAVLFWSLSFIWTKSVLDHITPLLLVAFRVCVALTLVFTFAKLTCKLQPISQRDAITFALLACAEPVGYFLFETFGLSNVSPTLACVIVSTIPLFTPILACIVNGERISKKVWVGLIVSMLGVLLVVLADGLTHLSGRLLGVMLLFGAVFTAMIYAVTVQRLARRFNSFSIVAWQNVFAVSIMIPLVLIFDFQQLSTLSFSWDWVKGVLALGVLCSSVAFVLYADGIRALGVARTTIFVNLMPSYTVIASYFILNESISPVKILGIIVTIAGLFIGTFSRRSIHL